MSRCPGLHCDGCGSGGGPTAGAVIALIALAAFIAARHTIEHAAVDVLHAIEIGLIALAALTVAGLVTAAVIAAERARRRRRACATLPAAVPAGSVRFWHRSVIAGRPQTRRPALPAVVTVHAVTAPRYQTAIGAAPAADDQTGAYVVLVREPGIEVPR